MGSDELFSLLSSLTLSAALRWVSVPPCHREFETQSWSVIYTGSRSSTGSPNTQRCPSGSRPGLGGPLLAVGSQAWVPAQSNILFNIFIPEVQPAPYQPWLLPPSPAWPHPTPQAALISVASYCPLPSLWVATMLVHATALSPLGSCPSLFTRPLPTLSNSAAREAF